MLRIGSLKFPPPRAAFELPAVFVFELCGPARFINCGGYALK